MYRTPDSGTPYGIFWLSLSETASFNSCYDSLAILEPELRGDQWIDACNGFYVSLANGIPRVSFFARNSSKPAAVVDSICRRTGLNQVKPSQDVSTVHFSVHYGGTELEFRKYLCDYTQLGLDLLGSDRIETQRLLATYRWQVQPSHGDARSYLEPALLRMSATYDSFSRKHRDTFWTDFNFRGGQTPWDHMFVNLVLGYDSSVIAPLSNAQISSMVADAGHDFDVPDDWQP